MNTGLWRTSIPSPFRGEARGRRAVFRPAEGQSVTSYLAVSAGNRRSAGFVKIINSYAKNVTKTALDFTLWILME